MHCLIKWNHKNSLFWWKRWCLDLNTSIKFPFQPWDGCIFDFFEKRRKWRKLQFWCRYAIRKSQLKKYPERLLQNWKSCKLWKIDDSRKGQKAVFEEENSSQAPWNPIREVWLRPIVFQNCEPGNYCITEKSQKWCSHHKENKESAKIRNSSADTILEEESQHTEIEAHKQ